MLSVHLSLNVINVFQMLALFERTYFLNKQGSKNVCIHLDENMTTQVKITSLRAM
jgi:hypothetical protein